MKAYLEKIDNGEILTSEELWNLTSMSIKDIYEENRRWSRKVTSIVKIENRYFSIDWEEGLTEIQENEYYYQPIEVYPREVTKVVTETIYTTEKETQVAIKEDNTLSTSICDRIVEFEKQVKAIKEVEDKLKEEILRQMEEKNIVKLDSDNLAISYIAPTYRESFDSKQLKNDNEELYNKYTKISPVKSSIRIKVK